MRVLPALGGAFIHAAGLNLGGRGLLFAGLADWVRQHVDDEIGEPAHLLAAVEDQAVGGGPGAGADVFEAPDLGEDLIERNLRI